jgi:hypothetical protein
MLDPLADVVRLVILEEVVHAIIILATSKTGALGAKVKLVATS